ncbi:MAG: hypothetical protein IJZ16_04440 [Clostridia bacterium]|nr:hypothetical protein [Clostridia bacterium]
MTSQKSLKNNVNKNDLRRSLIGSLPFPAIAFLVLFIFLTIPVIQYVTSEDFVMAKEHLEYSMFLAPESTFYYTFELLPVGMVACGILTAVKSFYYLLSKKQVNVYLSLGIKRNTMFTNRLFSGIVTLFVAVFVPILIVYITNIVCFGISAHLTKLFIYFVSLLFVCGLSGFAIASAMMMVSGNIFEAALSTLAFTVIPFCAFSTAYSLAWGYLKGYIRNFDYDMLMQVFTPWTMAINLQNEYRNVYMDDMYDYSDYIDPRYILKLLERDTTPDKFQVPEYMNVDWGFILPVVMWLVISVVLIGVTFYLFNKRKAEHANSLGKFPVSRAVIGTCIFTAITWIGAEWFAAEYSFTVLFVVTVAAVLIAYFLVQLILTRKPKTAFRSMKWCYVLIGVFAVCCILINTGFLGTYNKIPDKAEVKSVTIEAHELSGYQHFIHPWDYTENYVESSTDESKETVLEVFELLKEEKVEYDKDWLTSVTLGIRDNENKTKYREFKIYSEETYLKYIQLVYGSDYFDAILKNYLVDDIPENSQNDSTGYLKTFDWAYTDSDMIYRVEDGLDYVEDVDGLCEALYKDLSVMSVDELFKNNNHPVGILAKCYPGSDYPGDTAAYAEDVYYPMSDRGAVEYADDKVYEEIEYNHALLTNYIAVCPEMKNTIDFLKANGYEITEEPMKIKEVLYTDEPLSLVSAKYKFAEANKDDYRGWGTYTSMFYDYEELMFNQGVLRFFANDTVAYFLDEPATEYEVINRVYKDAGHPLISVTDPEKAQKIIDKTVSQYLTVNDNGRYVYVVYEEGVMACYYLPEANVNVVK